MTRFPFGPLLTGLLAGGSGAFLLAACHPKVQIEASKEPITINLNVKIEHEIRVRVDEDLDNLFEEDDGIF